VTVSALEGMEPPISAAAFDHSVDLVRYFRAALSAAAFLVKA